MLQTISTRSLPEAQKLIQKAKRENKRPIIVQAQDIEFNRKILEYGKFDILLSIEKHAEKHKDVAKQLDSGLNEIMARIATKKNIAMGINLEEIRGLEEREKALRLMRIAQNLKVCKKAKTKIAINTKYDKKDLASFLINLGASTKQAASTIYF